MKRRMTIWIILVAALMLLTVNFGGSMKSSHKLVKVGGATNHCDCTYRIQ
jgi:hypothetical protein